MINITFEAIGADLDFMVASTTWLVRKGYQALAIDMRDEFVIEWCIPPQEWNSHVDRTIDYVRRKGETPGLSEDYLRAVRY